MQHGADFYFGGGLATDVTVAAIAIAGIAAIFVLLLPRRLAAVPFLAAALLIPIYQQVVIGPFHLTMARIVLLIALLRLTIPKPRRVRWNRMDSIFLAYCLCNSAIFIILWGGEAGTFVNRLGFLLNHLGAYWIFRLSLRSIEDIERCVKAMVVLIAVIAAGMAGEQATGRNLFAVAGGVRPESVRREGRFRAQGPFVHPLTAGVAGATLLPIAFGLWWTAKRRPRKRANARKWAAAGMLAATVAAGASASSSGPLALLAGAGALALWPARRYLNAIRWAGAGMLVLLHMVMNAPVWALIARIDLTGSSTGYHRYMLVDQFIRRFPEWWLAGVRGTEQWGIDMWDAINSYVAAGTGGGLATLCLYIAIYAAGFRMVGKMRRRGDVCLSRWAWILGCTLFAHTVAVFGIAYFDQSLFVWLFDLAAIASLPSMRPKEAAPPPAAVEDDTASAWPWLFPEPVPPSLADTER